MKEFLEALVDPGVPFIRYALWVGLVSSVPFGVMGSFVVALRISYLAGAIAHAVLGGVGFAVFARSQWGWDWFHPRLGALGAALGAALLIGWVHERQRDREDTVIGAIWSLGMAAGLLFFAKTPGYFDPMSYLFGNILILRPSDIWLTGGLAVLVLVVVGMFYKELVAVCFDPEMAALRGVPVERIYFVMLGLTALTVVVFVSLVGIVLVIALLALPAAAAGRWARTFWQMMAGATVLCGGMTATGLAVSYRFELPTGPTIILGAALVYFLAILLPARFGGRVRRG